MGSTFQRAYEQSRTQQQERRALAALQPRYCPIAADFKTFTDEVEARYLGHLNEVREAVASALLTHAGWLVWDGFWNHYADLDSTHRRNFTAKNHPCLWDVFTEVSLRIRRTQRLLLPMPRRYVLLETEFRGLIAPPDLHGSAAEAEEDEEDLADDDDDPTRLSVGRYG